MSKDASKNTDVKQTGGKKPSDYRRDNPKDRANNDQKKGSPKSGFPSGKKQDPYWYAKDTGAISDFASLPFVNVMGEDYGLSDSTPISSPGIAIATFTPVIPGSDWAQKDNYATRAANAYYQSVSQGFSANFDFEAPDLLMTAIAASAVGMLMATGARAIGCLNYFLQDNAYWSKRVIQALGFNYADLRAQKKEFIAQYNLCVEQINKTIAVPKEFFIGERWRYLCANVFAESEPANYTTLIAYRPDSVPKYEGVRFETGTSLSYVTVPEGLTVSEFFTLVNELIEALTGDDQRQMFGAIRRVYPASDLVTLNTIDSSYTTTIEDNIVQSVQLHNSMWTDFVYACGPNGQSGVRDDETDVCCYQTQDGQVATDYFVHFNIASLKKHLISLAGVEDSASIMLDISANIFAVDSDNQLYDADNELVIGYKAYPRCEILTGFNVYYLTGSYHPVAQFSLLNNTSSLAAFVTKMSDVSKINRHPILYVMNENDEITHVIGQIDKYTVVSSEFIRNLNNKTAYQLLALPVNSKSLTK